jgi:SOS-response transcriptional repressor LexA
MTIPNFKRDQTVLNYIIRYKSEHDGNSPSLRQIMAACKVSSTSVMVNILQRLERAGLIALGGRYRQIYVTGGKWTMES